MGDYKKYLCALNDQLLTIKWRRRALLLRSFPHDKLPVRRCPLLPACKTARRCQVCPFYWAILEDAGDVFIPRLYIIMSKQNPSCFNLLYLSHQQLLYVGWSRLARAFPTGFSYEYYVLFGINSLMILKVEKGGGRGLKALTDWKLLILENVMDIGSCFK